MPDARLNLFRIPGRIGNRILVSYLTENVAVHQHIWMTLGQKYHRHFSATIIGGMLQVKFPRGAPLQDSMYGSAEPTLVCKVLSPNL